MKRLATGILAAALALGLAACDGQDQPRVEAPEQRPTESSAPNTQGAPTIPEANRPSDVPAEPLNPTFTPGEPPDAGTSGMTDGAMVPEGTEASPGGNTPSGPTEGEPSEVQPQQ